MTMKYITYSEYQRKLYGCFMGKAVGGTLGMSREGCLDVKQVTYYDPVPEEMVPNDDLDLQVANLEIIRRRGLPVNRRYLAEFWSRYITCYPDEYGVADKNMTIGLYPPVSGYYTNKFYGGMGAAIRSELWACLCPGDPELAVCLAREDACSDHYSDGIDACVFLTAVESSAFLESDMNKLLKTGLSYITKNKRMSSAFCDTIRWWQETGSILVVRERILEGYPSQNWTDVTINLSFIILSWLAGRDDFGKAICTAATLGYDADCTTATIGAILGLIHPDGMGEKWTRPIAGRMELSPCIVGMHEPATVAEFCARIAETCVEVQKYYHSAVRMSAETNAPLPVYTGSKAWTKRYELVGLCKHDAPTESLAAVEPLAVRVVYPEKVALAYDCPEELTVRIANPGEEKVKGTVSFCLPEQWKATPQEAPFHLEPGGENDIKLSIRIPRIDKRPYRNMLDMHFAANGVKWTVSAGIVLPQSWLRVQGKQEGDSCPSLEQFRNAEIIDAPSNIAPVPVGEYLYMADVKAYTKMTVSMVAQGTRPMRMWINERLITSHEGAQYVPAMHRGKYVVVDTLENGWNRIVIEAGKGTNRQGEFFIGFGGVYDWKWAVPLEWRLPVFLTDGNI